MQRETTAHAARRAMIYVLLGFVEFVGRVACGLCGCVFVLAAMWWAHSLFYSVARWLELGIGICLIYIACSPSRLAINQPGGIAIFAALALVVINAVWSLIRATAGQADSELALASAAAVAAGVTVVARWVRR